MQFTKRQQQAIDITTHNILVNAAAGSGKTAVLVERLFTRILAGQSLDAFIVITFTKLAASEMKERLSKRISETLATLDRENDLYAHLIYVETQIPTCHISTIDAFCSFIIREYGYMLPSITKQLSLIDSVDYEKMNQEVFLEFADVILQTPEYLRIAEQYVDIRDVADQKLLSMLLTVLPEFANVANHQKRYEELLLASKTIESVEELPLFAGFVERQKTILNDIDAQSLSLFAYSERYERDIVQLNQYIETLRQVFDEMTTYREIQEMIAHLKFPRKPAIPKDEQDVESENEYKKMREGLKKQLDAIRAPFQVDAEVEVMMINEARSMMQIFIDMAYAFYVRSQQKRLHAGKVLFSDISQLAYAILSEEEMQVKWRAKIQEVMIDEYQDTTRAQEELFATFGADKLFLVGDMKQAIYRFRQSDPLLFAEKNIGYREENEHTVIDLNQNFRSRSRVLAYINQVFEPLMDEQVGEMQYDENAKLYFGLDMYEGADEPISLLLVDKEAEEDPDRVQAEMIISGIKQCIQNKTPIFEKGATRPITYSDIAILTRNNTSRFLDVLIEELERQGIPFEKEGKTKFHAHLEVIWIVAMLKLLDNPLDDIVCATVLKSPFAKISIQTLYAIAKEDGETLYEKARQFSNPAVTLFFERFDMIRAHLFTLSPTQLLRRIIRDFSFEYAIEAMDESIRRKQNIEVIYELSKAIETSRHVGYSQYVSYLTRQIEQDNITINTPKISEKKHAITIQTFHKSKGLEYPVVFVANTQKKFNLQTDDSLYKLKNAGIVRAYHETREVRYQTFESMLCKDQLRHEALSEEMRLFYVALTRAREKLYITGITDRTNSDAEKTGAGMYPYHLRIGAQSMLDWVLLAYANQKTNIDVKFYDQATAKMLFEDAKLEDETKMRVLSQDAQNSLIWEDDKKGYQEVPLKLSVTELKKRQALEEADQLMKQVAFDQVVKPRLQVEEVTSAEIGTATHTLFEHFDFTKTSKGDIDVQVEQLVLKQQIKPLIAKRIDTDKIARFLQSELGVRMIEAPVLKREVPFRMMIDAALAGYTRVEAEILVQGVIDVLVVDDIQKEVYIVDYKTDAMNRFKTEQEKVNQLNERYRVQARLYEEAMKRIYVGYDVRMYFVTLDDTYVYLYEDDVLNIQKNRR